MDLNGSHVNHLINQPIIWPTQKVLAVTSRDSNHYQYQRTQFDSILRQINKSSIFHNFFTSDEIPFSVIPVPWRYSNYPSSKRIFHQNSVQVSFLLHRSCIPSLPHLPTLHYPHNAEPHLTTSLCKRIDSPTDASLLFLNQTIYKRLHIVFIGPCIIW